MGLNDMELETLTDSSLSAWNKDLELAEAVMLQQPQVACPVVHHFGPGIYIREVFLPAGAWAIGHRQKYPHVNVMLKGRVVVLNEDGSTSELQAPLMFVGQPGRKVGHVLEDVVWQNIYATDETDVEKLEAHFLDKSPTWTLNQQQIKAQSVAAREADRQDFDVMLRQSGFSHEVVQSQSLNEDDQTPLPQGSWKLKIAPSDIAGKGVFVTSSVDAGEVIAPARLNGLRTPAGRYTNHARVPNARMELLPSGDIQLVAMRPISGCMGGMDGEEVTIDYRQALSLSGIKCIGETA